MEIIYTEKLILSQVRKLGIVQKTFSEQQQNKQKKGVKQMFFRTKPHLGYEIWAERYDTFGKEIGYEIVAAFVYFQEALEFKDYAIKRGVPCVIRSAMPFYDNTDNFVYSTERYYCSNQELNP